MLFSKDLTCRTSKYPSQIIDLFTVENYLRQESKKCTTRLERGAWSRLLFAAISQENIQFTMQVMMQYRCDQK